MHIDIIKLYGFTTWANDCVFDGAGQLAEDLLRAPIRPGFLSVFDLLVHMMAAEQIWLKRCQGESPTSLVSPADVPDLATLRSLWAVQRAEVLDFLATVGDANQILEYKTTKGKVYQDVLWHILLHLVNHATEHRSQAAFYLAIHGIDVGGLDLFRYIREIDI